MIKKGGGGENERRTNDNARGYDHSLLLADDFYAPVQQSTEVQAAKIKRGVRAHDGHPLDPAN